MLIQVSKKGPWGYIPVSAILAVLNDKHDVVFCNARFLTKQMVIYSNIGAHRD